MTKELEKDLFDIEPVNFLEDYKLDIEDLSYKIVSTQKDAVLYVYYIKTLYLVDSILTLMYTIRFNMLYKLV